MRKWMPRILSFVITASTVSSANGFAQAEKGQGGPPPPPPVRAIPGLTAEDPHPRACVDCHVVMKDFNMDVWSSQGLVDTLAPRSVSGFELLGAHASEMPVTA